MSDQETTSPDQQETVVTDQPADSENQPEPVNDDSGSHDGESSGDDQDEEIEFDFGGGNKGKFKSSASAKEIFEEAQRQFKAVEANYTRKQQEVAEQRKSAQAHLESAQKLSSLQHDSLLVLSQAMPVLEEIKRLEGINLNRLWRENPDNARSVSDALAQSREQFSRLSAQYDEIDNRMSQEKSILADKTAEENASIIEKRIPGITSKRDEIIAYAAENYGVSKEQATAAWRADPVMAQMAYKAMMYDRAVAAKQSSTKPATVVDGKKFKGSATTALDLNKDAHRMTTEDWIKRRQAEIAKRRK